MNHRRRGSWNDSKPGRKSRTERFDGIKGQRFGPHRVRVFVLFKRLRLEYRFVGGKRCAWILTIYGQLTAGNHSLSLRDVEELLKERGLEADHTTNKGRHCIPEHHECKAKFILHLQQVLNLNPQQISGVLLVEGPPFSLNDYDVDRILAEVRTSKPDAKVACVHEGAD